MRRIADKNILVRYLTGDDEKAAAKATEIIRKGSKLFLKQFRKPYMC